MLDPVIEIFEEAKHHRATDNPKYRLGDPQCWSILTNEQRDVINEWYFTQMIDERTKRYEDQKREKNNTINASYFALIPFAAVTTYKHSGFTSFFRFVFSFAASCLIYMLVFYIFSSVYTGLIVPKLSTSRTASALWVCFGAALTVIITLMVSMQVFK